MQEKEYAQISEFGLGSLIGDFFENVKDTVKGVAKAVAPIAPFIIPFAAPALAGTGIGSLLGGGVGKFLTSKVGQAALGAGISALAGQKPADIAKNLALQVATTGIRGALSGGEGTMGQKFMSGVTGEEIPQVTNIPDVPPPDPDKGFFSQAGEKFMQTFDPRRRGTNPEFAKLKALGDLTGNPISDEAIIGLGIPKESSFTYQYGPALYTGLSSLPIIEQYLGPEQEEVDPYISQNLYAMEPAAYQIGSITGYNPQGFFQGPTSLVPRDQAQQIANQFNIPMTVGAEGGEVTGFAEGGGQKIRHPDGDTKEHPKRIGEIVGRGTGTSDDIPAMLSDGEFVMTAKAVRNAGGGSRKQGAKNMYKMMKSLENGGSLQRIGMA